MSSELHHPVLAYFRLLEKRARRSRTTDSIAEAVGLPLTALDNAALVFIAGTAGTTVSALAAATGVSLARGSRHAAALEDLGLIERVPSVIDARSTTLTLSARGREVRRVWVAHWTRDYDDATAHLPHEERTALDRSVERLQADLSRQPEFRELSAGHADPTAARLSPIIAFAQWAAPAITHPSYARTLIERTGAPLSPQSLHLLRAVAASSGSDISTLAELAGIDSSSVSRHVAKMEEDRLVWRAPNPADARGTVVQPTRAGRHILAAAEALELEPVGRALASWSMADIDELLSGIDSLVAGLSNTPAASQRSIR